MPITQDLGGKNYTLGKGKVYFDRFRATDVANGIVAATQGEGERYFGNTPGFTTTSESEDLDHFDSDNGVRSKDDSVQLSFERTGTITVDNISIPNVALYFLGDESPIVQVAATASTYVRAKVTKGTFFQVGQTPALPTGVRQISNVIVKTGALFADTVPMAGNYQVDEVGGRILILPGATAIDDGDDVQVTYDTAAVTRQQVISSSQSIYGAIRYEATNPKGILLDYYFPYVKLTPTGDYNLKGDDWMTMEFAIEILKKGNLESVYVDGRPVATV